MENIGGIAGENRSSTFQETGAELAPLAQRYFKVATVFLVWGLVVGLHMSITKNHGAHAAHAHINLIGWVTSALFGMYYALHPRKASLNIAAVQFAVYVGGCVLLLPTLYLLVTGNASVEPVVAAGSLAVFLGVLLFAFVVFRKE